ncbi:lysine N(6)-hydroxylase/L-ornithine N(5)-oxygenase family protein [Gordonia sp. C13]|uniref:lysine N(6)-hydroxylase/L-ornithine N(5)-oxygenase family protein n=1 Tax=Gordonia sp. C13 TaxID=2935078 RepID=UPI00200B0B02|nr:SidA/IucD/PvdA family monooxygenase [Gordonia sp. C13]MCK8613058.1 SidA/IucD/PvdA family monooxygenase [Gordonia sp. C13]
MTRVENVDVLAIGCGPFNLGLAALASTVDDLDVLVVDSRDEFRWHPGLMFDEARLQVGFLSDLVTLVDPTHPMSFLNYMAHTDRMYRFLVRENFYPTRVEYEAYLRWCIDRLDTLRWGTTVTGVTWDDAADAFAVTIVSGGTTSTVAARHVVVGVGTEPFVPESLSSDSSAVVHSSDYLYHQDKAHAADTVTVIGSGQSGAEIVIDLLEANLRGGPSVRWWTRTPWFAPLDFTKMSLEMTTPAYMDYFQSLPEEARDRIRPQHWQFHKGVSSDTLERVHELMYQRQLREKLNPVQLRISTEVDAIDTLADGKLRVRGRHLDTGTQLAHTTDMVIACTGYQPRPTPFLDPIDSRLHRDSRGRLVIGAAHQVEAEPALANRLFVANAEEHAVGVSAPNLDIGAVRNARILNAVTGREVYRLPKDTAFTAFGADDLDDVVS